MKLSDSSYLGYVSQVSSDGQLVIRLDSDFDLKNIKTEEPILIRVNKSDQTLVPFFFSRKLNSKGQSFTIFLDPKVHFPSDALPLKGKTVYIRKFKSEKSESSELNLTDIVNYEVIDDAKGMIGFVSEYYDSAAHPIVAIKDIEHREILIPFVEGVIKEIDSEKKILYVNCPEGLIDLYIN